MIVENGFILEKSETNYFKSPKCPIASDYFLSQEYNIVLNEAGSIVALSYFVEIIDTLHTSSSSFVDFYEDGNLNPNKEEYQGMRTFFIMFEWGKGMVAFLSDASIVINELFDEEFSQFDNIPFVIDVVDYMLALKDYSPEVIIDESHRFWLPIGSHGVIGFITGLFGIFEANPMTTGTTAVILLGIIYLSYSRKSPWTILKKRRYNAAVKTIELKNRISEHGPSYSPIMTLEEAILSDIGGMINVYGLNSFLHVYTQQKIAKLIEEGLHNELSDFIGIKLKSHEYYRIIKYIDYINNIEEKS